MRKPIIVGNWKMNKTIAEAVAFINEVDGVCHDGATYGVGTSFLALNEANKLAKNLVIAAENCHWEDSGAFTGEVSVPKSELNTVLSVTLNVVKCLEILMKQ